MYLWIIKLPNISAYLENVSVELCVEEVSAECRVISEKKISYSFLANCHGCMNQHLVRSYICACQTLTVKQKVKQSTNKNQTKKCFVQFTKSCCSSFFITSLTTSFSIAVHLRQQFSMRLPISLLLKNTIYLLFFFFFLEHKLYGSLQSKNSDFNLYGLYY